MAKPRLCIKLLICDLLRSELCLPYSNRPRYRTRIRSARNFSIHHCALRSDTPRDLILASSGLSERCPKIGDVPKSPFHTVAALVPSVGIITLQIELHSDACAISTAPPPTPRTACGARAVSERRQPCTLLQFEREWLSEAFNKAI